MHQFLVQYQFFIDMPIQLSAKSDFVFMRTMKSKRKLASGFLIKVVCLCIYLLAYKIALIFTTKHLSKIFVCFLLN